MSSPCLVDGGRDKYVEVVNMVRIYRALFRELNGIAMLGSAATSKILPRTTKINKDGEEVPVMDPGAFKVRRDYKQSKELVANALNGLAGKAKYYELRNAFCRVVANLSASGVITFGTHMFDTLRVRLAAERDKKVILPSGKELPRSHMEVVGAFDAIPVRNLGVPFMHSATRSCASLIEDERGVRLRVQWGHKEDCADLILKGSVQVGDKKLERKPAWSIEYMLHKMLTGEWEWQTPVLNLHDDGKLFVTIPFARPTAEKFLKPGSVAELSYMPIYGRDLWRTKADRMGTGTGKHDNMRYVVHLTQGKQKFALAANDVIADFDRYTRQRVYWEEYRDSRRRWTRRLRKPAAEHINALAGARLRRMRDANHAWSRQVCQRAFSWGCSKIKVFKFPDGAAHGLTGDKAYSWSWSQFMQFLQYKAEEKGIAIEVVESIDPEKLLERMTHAVESDSCSSDDDVSIAAVTAAG